MSDIQQFLALMADALHNGALGEEGCADLAKALNGVPAEYHAAAFKAFLSGDDEVQDAQEDYAVIKTFDSLTFHIGDEITDGKDKFVITGFDKTGLVRVMGHTGLVGADLERTTLKRTGRNFPAIPAIMEKLKKGVDKSAGTL